MASSPAPATCAFQVLIVDDDRDYRLLIRTTLEAAGYEVREAAGVAEALAQLDAWGELPPVLIVVDFHMGPRSGYELLRDLRSRAISRRVPVLMLSSTSKRIKDLLAVEGASFVPKTHSLAAFLGEVRRLAPAPPRPLGGLLVERVACAREPLDADKSPAPEAPAPEPAPSPLPPIPIIPPLRPPPRPDEADQPAPEAADPLISTTIDAMLVEAVRRGASDLHIEPFPDRVRVRARIDGALEPLTEIRPEHRDALTARIKVLASLDITERRLPQDGKFRREDGAGRTVEFRVSTLPSVYGETIVLRVLRSDEKISLERLGLGAKSAALVRQVLRSSGGLILVTGPTGSGKTSTLYSMLQELNSPHRKIVTAEDPVEYQLDGITQVQVNPAIGYTFERVLRSFLRQDPNVMLIGEIRDAETADIALKAAVTGHTVLSSVHTNDASGAVQRLLSMGLPDYLVAAATRLVIAQRLLRTLCLGCRRRDALSSDESALLSPAEREQLQQVWRPVGCPRCHGTGYKGRQPIFEVFHIGSPRVLGALVDKTDPEALRSLARAEGALSLRSEALALAAAGLSSPEEAFAFLESL